MAANTPTNYYIDTPAVKAACKSDFKKIDDACKPDGDNADKNKHPALKKLLGAKRVHALESMANKAKEKIGFNPGADNGWMSHCDGLWIKPGAAGSEDVAAFNDQIRHMADDLAGAIESQLKPLVEQVGQEVRDAAVQAAKDKAAKAGVRSAARWGVGAAGAAVGGVGAIVTEAVATAWNIVDWAVTGVETVKLGAEAYGAIKEMRAIVDIAQKAQGELAELAREAATKTPTDLMAEGMGVLSRLNRCTRARRCKLVPYSKAGGPGSIGGDGCCPGQSGHHVIPDEAAKGNCDGYTHGGAPTICVEGANNSNGTHGKIHTALDNSVQDHKDGGPFGISASDTISYGKMRELGIKSIQTTFPESRCDEKCLRAQLDAYYKDKCKKPLAAKSGAGNKGNTGSSAGKK